LSKLSPPAAKPAATESAAAATAAAARKNNLACFPRRSDWRCPGITSAAVATAAAVAGAAAYARTDDKAKMHRSVGLLLLLPL